MRSVFSCGTVGKDPAFLLRCLGCCCGTSVIPDPGTSICTGVAEKENKQTRNIFFLKALLYSESIERAHMSAHTHDAFSISGNGSSS